MNYEDRFIFFVDILGFKKIIEETTDNGLDNEMSIVNIYLALHSLRRTSIGIGNNDSTKMSQFSDCIAISFSKNKEVAFLEMLEEISWTLQSLIRHNIICRGALTFGKLYHDDEIIFGPAIVSAYEAELNFAIYPRIIIDNSALDVFNEKISTKSDHIKKFVTDRLNYYLKKDFDGRLYFDYFIQNGMTYKKYINFLKTIREIIITGVAHSTSAKIKEKFIWMEDKYNKKIHDICMQRDNEIFSKKFTRKQLEEFKASIKSLEIK